MKMYVANATKQKIDFAYRLPEINGARVQQIPIGGQIQLTGELNQLQVDSIIEQFGKYGMISVDEVDRSKAFTGLCYSIDKFVPVSKIMQAVRVNESVLQERGQLIRKESAIAENNRIEQIMQESGIPGELRKLELTVQEEKARDDGDQFSEGVKVTRNEPESLPARGQRQRRR